LIASSFFRIKDVDHNDNIPEEVKNFEDPGYLGKNRTKNYTVLVISDNFLV
jgi:hypothetical protein